MGLLTGFDLVAYPGGKFRFGGDLDPIRVAAVLALTGIAAAHNAPLVPMLEFAVGEVSHSAVIIEIKDGKPRYLKTLSP